MNPSDTERTIQIKERKKRTRAPKKTAVSSESQAVTQAVPSFPAENRVPSVPQVFTEEVMNAPEPIPTQIGFPTDVPSGTVKRRNRRAKHKIQ